MEISEMLAENCFSAGVSSQIGISHIISELFSKSSQIN